MQAKESLSVPVAAKRARDELANEEEHAQIALVRNDKRLGVEASFTLFVACTAPKGKPVPRYSISESNYLITFECCFLQRTTKSPRDLLALSSHVLLFGHHVTSMDFTVRTQP